MLFFPFNIVICKILQKNWSYLKLRLLDHIFIRQQKSVDVGLDVFVLNIHFMACKGTHCLALHQLIPLALISTYSRCNVPLYFEKSAGNSG